MKHNRIKRKKNFNNLQIVIKTMRIVLFFLCITLFSVTANTYSQEDRIELHLKNTSIKDLFTEIEKQSDYVFLLSGSIENELNKKIDIQVDTESVEEILKVIISLTNLKYDIVDRQIVIYTNKELSKNKFALVNIKREEQPIQQPTQQRLSGIVTDKKDGLPIIGANVSIPNTTTGTITDEKGRFSLSVPVGSILRFSYIGYITQEFKITNQTILNVQLVEDISEIDEIVITGYANIKKESYTGNVTTVDSKQLLNTNNKNVISALQVFEPSFRILDNNYWGSDPSSLPEFTIRGESSIPMDKGYDIELSRQTQRVNLENNPNLPIFILDGFEASVQKIYDMDINRIERIDILKDAAATALYGSRAANGVIVVTTKSPKAGELMVTYNLNMNVELPDLSDYNLANTAEKIEVEKLGGLFDNFPYDTRIYYSLLNLLAQGVNTDWMAQPLRNALNNKHTFYMEGGGKSFRYGIDFNYDTNNGAMKGSYRKRGGAGLYLDFHYRDKLIISNHISYSNINAMDSPYGVFSDYVRMNPYLKIRDENGEYIKEYSSLEFRAGSPDNPLWKTTLKSFSGKENFNDITNNLNINWRIIESLRFRGQFSITKTDKSIKSFTSPKDTKYNYVPLEQRGELKKYTDNGYSWNINALFYFNKLFGKHFINSTFGVNARKSELEKTDMLFKGFQLETLPSAAVAADHPQKPVVNFSESRLAGLLFSTNYSYNEIYYSDLSFRLDGSSAFGSNEKYAPFYSLGVGINIHNYQWLKSNPIISKLRLRGSNGTTGNVSFPPYTSTTTFNFGQESWHYTGLVTFLHSLGNPNLTWEKTNTTDVGFELGLFRGRLNLVANYYSKKTSDLIDNMFIRSSSGFSNFYTNSGNIENNGIELRMNVIAFRDQNWLVSFNGNLASNRNKITKLGRSMEEYNKRLEELFDKSSESYIKRVPPLRQFRVGESTTAIYGVQSVGIDPANGLEKFIKRDGSSTYTWSASDQVKLGDKTPKAQGAFGVNIAFREFYLNTNFLYAWGGQIYNTTLSNKIEQIDFSHNVDKRVLTDRWKKPGDIVPFRGMKSNQKVGHTSRFVQDNNFLIFNNISIGYDFRKEVIKKFNLTAFGLRFNANDIVRWTTVRQERGITYPYAKKYGLTLTLGF